MKLILEEDYKKAFQSTSGFQINNGSISNIERACYHISLTNAFSFTRGLITPENEKYYILPSETIWFRSNEYFRLEKNMVGLCVNRVWNTVRLLRVDTTFIDPEYNGELNIIVKNDSTSSVEINQRSFFLKVILFKLDEDIGSGRVSQNRIDLDNHRSSIQEQLNKNKARRKRLVIAYYLFFTLAFSGIIVSLFRSLSQENFLSAMQFVVPMAFVMVIFPIFEHFRNKLYK